MMGLMQNIINLNPPNLVDTKRSEQLKNFVK